jgi:hypothetical protein
MVARGVGANGIRDLQESVHALFGRPVNVAQRPRAEYLRRHEEGFAKAVDDTLAGEG